MFSGSKGFILFSVTRKNSPDLWGNPHASSLCFLNLLTHSWKAEFASFMIRLGCDAAKVASKDLTVPPTASHSLSYQDD